MASPQAKESRETSRRKAGGSGKKGKTFMEDKSDLLSLVSGITASKDAIAKSKVDKIKPLIKPTPPATGSNKSNTSTKGQKAMRSFGGAVAGGDKKKSSAGEKKRAEREKALADAKAAIIEKRRAKKVRKHEREGGVAGIADGVAAGTKLKPAKKVGFA